MLMLFSVTVLNYIHTAVYLNTFIISFFSGFKRVILIPLKGNIKSYTYIFDAHSYTVRTVVT